MKIGKKFNQLSKSEYFHYIENHKKYTDFNTLGLYRSIEENKNLSLEDQLEVLEFANRYFFKSYEFLQVKAPGTYLGLSTLGHNLTIGEYRQILANMEAFREAFIRRKRPGHRNFGQYSKHDCGIEHCPWNGMMVRQDSWFAEFHMYFDCDKNQWEAKRKSEALKKQRRESHKIIQKELE